MKDGSIINNSVNYTGTILMGGGAGVAVDFQTTSSGLFNMTGGKIQGNTTIGNKDYGSGVFVNGSTQEYLGIFKISGNAVVVSDNDVYLNYVAKITVTGELTGNTPVATITLSSYTSQKEVIQVEGVAFDSVIRKFSVTPKLNENDQEENWIINEIGQIVSN